MERSPRFFWTQPMEKESIEEHRFTQINKDNSIGSIEIGPSHCLLSSGVFCPD
jgi:hypothetical protein